MVVHVNDPQFRLPDFLPEYGHATPTSFQEVLSTLDEKATDPYRKGSLFEELVKAFIEEDRAQSERFDKVWLWEEYPRNGGRPDLGADLVARERDTGNEVAIQCKFYGPSTTVAIDGVNAFLSEAGRDNSRVAYSSTTHRWSRNATRAVSGRDNVNRWGP